MALRQVAHTLCAGVVRVRLDDGTVANDVVDDDDGTWPGELQRGFEVSRITWFVSVDEHQIEWLHPPS